MANLFNHKSFTLGAALFGLSFYLMATMPAGAETLSFGDTTTLGSGDNVGLGSVVIGGSGTGTVEINDGSTLNSDELVIGESGVGTLVVDGATVDIDGKAAFDPFTLVVGHTGPGFLVIQNGGVVNSGTINSPANCCINVIAASPGASGTVIVRGSGSALNLSGDNADLDVVGTGFGGGTAGATMTARLDVLDGGAINARKILLGSNFDGGSSISASMVVSGIVSGASPQRSRVDLTDLLLVGSGSPNADESTTASLDIMDGGIVNASRLIIASGSPPPSVSAGTITVSGVHDNDTPGDTSDDIRSELIVTGPSYFDVIVGTGGFPFDENVHHDFVGTLNVLDGAQVLAGAYNFGDTSVATINVDGAGSRLAIDPDTKLLGTNVGELTIVGRHEEGVASLNISGGGEVDAGVFVAVGSRQGTGTVIVSGSGSILKATGIDEGDGNIGAGFVFGHRGGTGHLTVTKGGKVLVNSNHDPDGDGGNPPITDLPSLALGSFFNLGGSGTGPGVGTAVVDGAGSIIEIDDNFSVMQVGRRDRGSLNVVRGGVVRLVDNDASANGFRLVLVGRLAEDIVGGLPEAVGDVLVDGTGSELDAGDLLAIALNFDFGTGTTFEPGGDGRVAVCNGGTIKADVIEVGANGTLIAGAFIEGSADPLMQDTFVNPQGQLIIGCSIASVVFPGTLHLAAGSIVLMEIDETGAADQLIVGSIVSDGGTISVIVHPDADILNQEITLIETTSGEQPDDSVINFEIVTVDESGETMVVSIETMVMGESLTLGFDADGTATVFSSEVTIDVKPGSDDNIINLLSKGVIPVAILSLDGFDATKINPATIELNGATVRSVGMGKALCNQEDVNGDEVIDLVCKVETEQFIPSEIDFAVLTATTFAGTEITGEDIVFIVQE